MDYIVTVRIYRDHALRVTAASEAEAHGVAVGEAMLAQEQLEPDSHGWTFAVTETEPVHTAALSGTEGGER